MRKYMLYAIGEVLLVMIGILLALQVNNWNNERIQANLEQDTLQEVLKSLDSNIEGLEKDSAALVGDTHKIRSLLNHIESALPYADSLEELFYYPLRSSPVNVDYTAYELLQNRGIDIISNVDLRKSIVHVYGYSLMRLEKMLAELGLNIMNFRDYYQKHVRFKLNDFFIMEHTGRKYQKAYPLNYSSLVNNEEFKSRLNWRIARFELRMDRLSMHLQKMRELREQIIEELSTSES